MSMDFKFNFEVGDSDRTGKGEPPEGCVDNDCLSPNKKSKTDDHGVSAKEIPLPEKTGALSEIEDKKTLEVKVDGVQFKVVDPADVEVKLKKDDCPLVNAIGQHSDLLPKVYEGGLKIWECCLDLVAFLNDSNVKFKDSRVLELGCGAGLPGIFALQNDAVVFLQDYNEEVIREVTMPNVILNYAGEFDDLEKKCKFFCGDWVDLQDTISGLIQNEGKFDVILTSETIYNTDSSSSLYSIIRSVLKPTGVVYLAEKTHYFGVGGGTRLFEELVNGKEEFKIEVCKTFTEGVKREILMMRWKHHS